MIIKMKNKNFISKNPEQPKVKHRCINVVEMRITRGLSEEYKTKHLCLIQTILNKNSQKRVAFGHE